MSIRCSHCGSNSIRRSKRRGVIEKALSIVVFPYRCRDCDHRFFPLFQTSRSACRNQRLSRFASCRGQRFFS
jgi:hypothetical protein